MTLCAPEWFHLRHGECDEDRVSHESSYRLAGEHAYDKSIYASDEAYFADIVTAYRAEIADLYAVGARNLQFDDPLLAYFCADSMISGMHDAGIDSEKLLDLYIDVYNQIIADHPKDLTIGVHLCRGNFRVRAPHFRRTSLHS